jgi:hypothetical protein
LLLSFVEDSVALSSGQVGGRIVADVDSNTFKIIRSWAKICQSSHSPDCESLIGSKITDGSPASTNLPLPTRILDISPTHDSSIRLVESKGTIAKYVALSHRWWENGSITTTKATLQERLSRIPFEDLSKTFQDAIRVTHGLGLYYLWIDALCIIQDDSADWEAESAEMGRVFENAEYTISASAAEDDTLGFLGPRHHDLVPMKYRRRAKQKPKGNMFLRRSTERYVQDVTSSPLNNRAWVLQERILSRRIIHFTKNQVYWECRRMVRHETWPQIDHRDGQAKDEREPNPFSTLLTRFSQKENQEHAMSLIYREWSKLVSQYSRMGLTKPSDKLPAVSGLINVIKRFIKSDKYFGIWTDDIFGLLWNAEQGSRPKPLEKRAPSWSWVALDCPVNYCLRPGLFAYLREWPTRTLKELVFHQAETSTRDVSLHVEAPLKSSEFILSKLSTTTPLFRSLPYANYISFHPPFYEVRETSEGESWLGLCKFDLDEDVPPTRSAICLPVVKCGDENHEHTCFLLLEPTGKPNEYVRVGVGWVDGLDWFDGLESQHAVLV